MLKTSEMFREGSKGEKGKTLRGGSFRKTSHKTSAVVSHSGTQSQISDRSITDIFEFSTKPL